MGNNREHEYYGDDTNRPVESKGGTNDIRR